MVMIKMLKKLTRRFINWFYVLRCRLTHKKLFDTDNPLGHAPQQDTVKECTRDRETRKRVAKAFAEQAQYMQARALKRHGFDCKDPSFCDKKDCFVWEPDKIVKRSMVSRAKRRVRQTFASKKLGCTKKI